MVNTENDVFYAYMKNCILPLTMIKRRSELISKCCHKNKFLLANYKAKINYQIVQFQYLHTIYI